MTSAHIFVTIFWSHIQTIVFNFLWNVSFSFDSFSEFLQNILTGYNYEKKLEINYLGNTHAISKNFIKT